MLFGLLLILSACQKEEIMTYDTTRSAINFISKTIEYTFLTNPEDEYIQEIEVRIMGDAMDVDRNFAVKVVDSLTTAQANQYEIIGGVVKAGEYEGILSVKLFNSDMLADTTLHICVEMIDSKDFLAGNIEKSRYTIKFTDKVVLPSWTYVKYFFCTYPSTECYRVLIASTGLTKFDRSDYIANGMAGAQALGTKFGDYIMEWNKNNPDNHLKHDDGVKAGEDIIPKYYTKSKYD